VTMALRRDNTFEVHVLKREEWLPPKRKTGLAIFLRTGRGSFPQVISGTPWLPHSYWQNWEEAFKTSYREYVKNQHDKDMTLYVVRDAVGRPEDIQNLNTMWINDLKVHGTFSPFSPGSRSTT
jgi:toluene monooxygenase system protein A